MSLSANQTSARGAGPPFAATAGAMQSHASAAARTGRAKKTREVSMIRVLAVLDDTVVSGKVKPVLTLARAARADSATPRPLELSMLTFSRTHEEPELVTSLRDENFPIDVVRENHRFDFGVFPQLRAIVDRVDPQIIWTHGAKTHFLVRIAGLYRGRTWVAFHHGYTATSLTWQLYDQLDRWSLRRADCVMTACDAFAADLHARLGIPTDRLRVHRSPLESRTFFPSEESVARLRAELGLSPERKIVLVVGRLSKEKGHADLLRALGDVNAAREHPAALVIVGDGPESERLERLAAELRIADAVHLVGYRRDVAPFYAAADVFALTSYSEGSPNVLLEAMDAGVPIVATAVGGVGEMIRDGEHGLLVPARDSQAIARALRRIIDDPKLSIALASSARESLTAYAPSRYYASMRADFEASVARAGPP